MLQRICFGFLVCLLGAAPLNAATVFEQTLPSTWITAPVASAFCSPCQASASVGRMFASFELGADTVLDGAGFAVLSNTFGALGDFSVSIWSSPFDASGPLLQTVVLESDYARLQGSRGFIDVRLPRWNLAAGSYWLSAFGVDGDSFQWGGLFGQGDDRRYVNGAVTLAPGSTLPANYFLGFSLRAQEPVATPVGGTLPLLAGGLALLALTRRRRTA